MKNLNYNFRENSQGRSLFRGLSVLSLLILWALGTSPAYAARGFCGDGKIQPRLNEVCDSNVRSCTTLEGYPGTKTCNMMCSAYEACVTTLFCGDGMCTNSAENYQNCPSDCADYCGNGIVGPTEECDDNNRRNNDGCNRYCLIEEVKVHIQTLKTEYTIDEPVELVAPLDPTDLFINNTNDPNAAQIANKTTRDVSGYLIMKVMRYNGNALEDVATIVDNTTPTTIERFQRIFLSPLWSAAEGFTPSEPGIYLAYAGLRGTDGRIIETPQGFLDSSYQFTVAPDGWELLFPNSASRDIITDGDMNVYTIAFNILPGTPQTLKVVKTTGDGNIIYDKSYPYILDENVGAATFDSQRNVIIAGFGHPDAGEPKLIKVQANTGNVQFEYPVPNQIINRLFSVTTDTQDNIYVVGNNLNQNLWGFSKLHPEGYLLYTSENFPGTMMDLLTDANGNIYFFGHITFDSVTNWHLVKYDSQFTLVWDKTFASTDHNMAATMAMDEQGTLFLVGHTASAADPSLKNWKIARVDSDGNMLWEYVTAEATGAHVANNIDYDLNGRIYVVGKYQNQWALMILDALSGARLHLRQYGAQEAYSIDVNLNNNVMYMAGISMPNVMRIMGKPIPQALSLTAPQFNSLEIQAMTVVSPIAVTDTNLGKREFRKWTLKKRR